MRTQRGTGTGHIPKLPRGFEVALADLFVIKHPVHRVAWSPKEGYALIVMTFTLSVPVGRNETAAIDTTRPARRAQRARRATAGRGRGVTVCPGQSLSAALTVEMIVPNKALRLSLSLSLSLSVFLCFM